MKNLIGNFDNIKMMSLTKREDDVSIELIDDGGSYSYFMGDFSMIGISCSEFGIQIVCESEEQIIKKLKESLN